MKHQLLTADFDIKSWLQVLDKQCFFHLTVILSYDDPGTKVFVECLNGVNRQPSNGQKSNRQPSKMGKFYRQPSKKQLLSAVKSQYFSCPSRTVGSQRIFLTGATHFHVPKYTHFTGIFHSFTSKLTIQLTSTWKYFRFQNINDDLHW